MMRMAQTHAKIQMYCDMHGHSRKAGAFFYGGLVWQVYGDAS